MRDLVVKIAIEKVIWQLERIQKTVTVL